MKKEITMIKFEEHDNQLFRMLEEPVPLAPDSEMPCLCGYIKDKSLAGEYNRRMRNASKIIDRKVIITEIRSSAAYDHELRFGFAKSSCEARYEQLEIIGYPVEEGSAEWGEYQTQQGIVVRHKHGCVVRPEYDSSSRASIFEHYPTGWQIYKEPKPLLADAKVGDLCKTDLDEWIQIDDTSEPPSPILYHFDRPFKGNIIHTEPLAPEGTAEWAWQMAKLGIETKCIYGKIRISDSGMIEVCYNGMAYAMPLTQSAENRKYVINKIRECSPDGWHNTEQEAINAWNTRPIEDALRKEIAQLQADNRSLVEQMNVMALKPNQAIIERHEYDHDNPETYPEKRGYYLCESASGKIELFWSPLGQVWYITEVHDKVYNHFQIKAYYTWVKAPKGVKHD